MSWQDKLKKFSILPDGTDEEEMKEELSLLISDVLEEFTNDRFGEYGVAASNDSFVGLDPAVNKLYDVMMLYVTAHDGLEMIDREDLR